VDAFVSLKPLLDSPATQFIALLFTFVGLPLAIVLYRRSKREKLPRFGYESRTLVEGISSALSGLKVVFLGTSQDRITVTRFYFWNAGEEPIRRADLVKSAPIRIDGPSTARILVATTVYKTDPAANFSVIQCIDSSPQQHLEIEFDYLDHRDGGVIQIVHTGPSSANFQVSGKIIGARPIDQRFALDYSSDKRDSIASGFNMVAYAVGWTVVALILSSLGGISIYQLLNGYHAGWMWLLAFVGCAGFFTALYMAVWGDYAPYKMGMMPPPKSSITSTG